MYISILGRQPALSLAELEARFGAEQVQPLTNRAALVDAPNGSIFPQLGGSLKFAKVLTTIKATAWGDITRYLEKSLPDRMSHLPEGKVTLGISTYGLDVKARQLNSTALKLKKLIKAAGRPVRVVPNQEPALSSAQTLHNELTGARGMELLLLQNGQETLLAQVVYVQDIESYTLRDRGRPERDARVGMLPPKLAQMIINLAAGNATIEHDEDVPYHEPRTLLDPFCGTGVVLQEAALMNFRVYGTDIDERMIRYSRDNINWLQEEFGRRYAWQLEVADATNHTWQRPLDVVACETYLGPPLSKPLPPKELDAVVQNCDELHRAFLANIHPQLPAGTRLCLAVPAWRVKSKFRHLPVIDDLAKLGYNRIDFTHVSNDDLIYFREDQLVARELLVLMRK